MSWFTDINVDGRDARLFLLPPDWRARPKLSHNLAAIEAEGGTGREARASEHHGMRLTLTLFFTLDAAAAEELLAEMLDLTDERLALPLWHDERTAAGYAAGKIYAAQHTVNFNGETGAHVVDGSGGHPITCGLLVGRLAAEPEIVATTDLHATIELQIEEDSPWASRIAVNTLAAPDWIWPPAWNNRPTVRRHTQHERQRIGHGRETAFLRPEAPVKRVDRASFILQGAADIRQFLTFWTAKRGPWTAFDVPAWFHPGYDDGDEPWLHTRFLDEVLVFEFLSPDEVRATVSFRQVFAPGGGEPAEERPSRATLVKVWWDGSATVFAWSDWESPLTHAAVDYQPSIVEVIRATETLRPGETEWELMVYDFAGNPLRAFALLAIERRLRIEIRECDPTNAAAAVLVFTGEIKTAPRKGQIYRAKCALFGGLLRHLVPNFFCQTSCNHTLYDDLCGIVANTHKVTGAVAAAASVVVDVSGGADKAADWFAYGYAVFGAGDTIELRYIVRSAPIAGGTRLTVHRPLFFNGVAAAVDFFPGCDGQFEGGCAKFANQDAFGGAPYKPDYIDSVDTGFKAKTGK